MRFGSMSDFGFHVEISLTLFHVGSGRSVQVTFVRSIYSARITCSLHSRGIGLPTAVPFLSHLWDKRIVWAQLETTWLAMRHLKRKDGTRLVMNTNYTIVLGPVDLLLDIKY